MPLRNLIGFTWVNYLAYCYIQKLQQQSLDYILTVIPDKRLVVVGTILCLNIYVSNGVKQGGVLSSMLFSLYIDPLLEKLKQTDVDCHIHGNFMGVLSYADDITLICQSIWGLNEVENLQYLKKRYFI